MPYNEINPIERITYLWALIILIKNTFTAGWSKKKDCSGVPCIRCYLDPDSCSKLRWHEIEKILKHNIETYEEMYITSEIKKCEAIL